MGTISLGVSATAGYVLSRGVPSLCKAPPPHLQGPARTLSPLSLDPLAPHVGPAHTQPCGVGTPRWGLQGWGPIGEECQ